MDVKLEIPKIRPTFDRKALRKKGITRRWIINVMAVFALVILVVEVAFGIFYQNYYYSTVAAAAQSYSQAFNVLSLVSPSEFSLKAREYAEEFAYKDKLEIHIIDSSGNTIVTTTGFKPVADTMPDYNAALKSADGSATWRGRSSSGQRIMAGTYLLSDRGSGSLGAVRWVIATEKVDRYVMLILLIYWIAGLLMLVFTAISGMYFVKSIVRPVQDVTSTAVKIAGGDFNARLDYSEEGEIGELCNAVNYIASELGEADKMKNDFISSVSHELRTPLTAIRGWGETVKMSVDGSDELVVKGIDVILSEAERLSGLVEELLDFSRMQSGSLSMNMTRIHLVDVLDDAACMYKELAKRQNIDLAFIRPKVSPVVVGDADRLKQVFINIIDNAIKYNKPGGQVLIEAKMEEACVRITVKDTGVGIPAADVDRVKEKFYKANKTVRGSGIGLAVADEIIKQHQGLLFLESIENVGTTLTIVLPTVPEESEEKSSAVDVPPSAVNITGEVVSMEELTEGSEDKDVK